jgi:hypothetical protein
MIQNLNIFLLVSSVLLFFSNSIRGQSLNQETIVRVDTISLATRSDTCPGIEVIVFMDDEKYTVYSSREAFEAHLKRKIDEDNLKWQRKLLKVIERMDQDTVNVPESELQERFGGEITYLFAHLIERKKCWIYGKEEQGFEEFVRIEYFKSGRNLFGKKYTLLNGDQILSMFTAITTNFKSAPEN